MAHRHTDLLWPVIDVRIVIIRTWRRLPQPGREYGTMPHCVK